MNWPEDKKQKLIKMFKEHRSTREMADELGTTRNAVLGKLFRLKLKNSRVKEKKPTPPAVRNLSSPIPNWGFCQFGFGNPGDDGFYFCGKPSVPGKPYCEECCKKTYRKRGKMNVQDIEVQAAGGTYWLSSYVLTKLDANDSPGAGVVPHIPYGISAYNVAISSKKQRDHGE